MPLRSAIEISAPADAVWPLVAMPERMPEWNPKVISIQRSVASPVLLGERFGMRYRMGSRETTSEVEVTEMTPGERVTYTHRVDTSKGAQVASEAYKLTPVGNGTRLEQRIDLPRGVPWIFRILISLVHRCGRPVGKTYLESLRDLAQAGQSATNTSQLDTPRT